MIQFMCVTSLCLQQWLGSGYVISQDDTTILFSTMQHIYLCNKSGPYYSCIKQNQKRLSNLSITYE